MHSNECWERFIDALYCVVCAEHAMQPVSLVPLVTIVVTGNSLLELQETNKLGRVKVAIRREAYLARYAIETRA